MINPNLCEALDRLRAELGDSYLLDELVAALGDGELKECIEWIARMNDIDLED